LKGDEMLLMSSSLIHTYTILTQHSLDFPNTTTPHSSAQNEINRAEVQH